MYPIRSPNTIWIEHDIGRRSLRVYNYKDVMLFKLYIKAFKRKVSCFNLSY